MEQLSPQQAQTDDSSETSATATLTEFHLFSDLPVELRLVIWWFALPRRAFELKLETEYAEHAAIHDHQRWRQAVAYAFSAVAVALKPPTLSRVCREARDVALRTVSVGTETAPSSSVRMLYSMGRLSPGDENGRVYPLEETYQTVNVWFNPTTDILCVYELGPSSDHWSCDHNFGLFSSIAETVSLDAGILLDILGERFLREWKASKGVLWPKVQDMRFHHDHLKLHVGRSERVAQIFGSGSDVSHSILVDPHDSDKLRLIFQVYVMESNHDYFHVETSDWLLQLLDPKGLEEYIRETRVNLEDLWLFKMSFMPEFNQSGDLCDIEYTKRQITRRTSVVCEVPVVDRENDWSREVLRNLPDFKLMIHVRLCTVDHNPLVQAPVERWDWLTMR